MGLKTRFTWGLGFGLMITLIAGGGDANANQNHPYFNRLFSDAADNFERLNRAYNELKARDSVRAIRRDPRRSLVLRSRIADHSLETTKFQDYLGEFEVVGSMAFHHRSAATSEVSDYLARFDLELTPTLTAVEAAAVAQALTNNKPLKEAPTLKILPSDDNSSARLVYWVTVLGRRIGEAGNDVIIDAHSGGIIANVSHWMTIMPEAQIEIYQAIPLCQELSDDGEPLAYDLSKCSNKTVGANGIAKDADPDAVRAHANSKRTFDYFINRFGRNSYDDAGATLVNVVHIGHKFSNAFWNSEAKIMAYGDGDGIEFRSFTHGLDVAGHEMTHALTSSTAGLLYFGEYGALNEAYSDFFGKMIANDGHWLIGKDLFADRKKIQGIRDLANPAGMLTGPKGGSKPYPAHIKDRLITFDGCDKSNDTCFVHINSTIMSHAAFRMHESIGREKTEQIQYRTLTQLIGPRTNFRTARNATVMACGQLYDSTTCDQVKQAFAEVGL